jgi:hypothetical protein
MCVLATGVGQMSSGDQRWRQIATSDQRQRRDGDAVPPRFRGIKLGELDGPSSSSRHHGLASDNQTAIMVGPELTVLGVAEAELPVSSETEMLL